MNKSFGIFCAAFLLVATTSATQAQKTAPAEKKATSKSVDQSNAPVEGKLYVLKPGRLRFEYAQPATMEIIADGTSVAIRDRKLQTQEIYFISQTPLKFLLKSQMKLEKDVKIIDVSATESGTLITVEDSTTFGGTSRIKLNFDNTKFSLTQWEVTDPQGYVTSVTLHNVDLKTVPEKGLFRIPSENVWPSQN
jgi:outer membrane lipoprotein-sorting protein